MLKRLLIAATTIAACLLVLTVIALLGTVTHADAVRYSDWIEVTKVTDPLPGQLYAVSDDGVIEGQICLLTRDDFVTKQEELADQRFVNRLGKNVPFALWIAKLYLPAGHDDELTFEIDYRLEWRDLEREFAPRSSLLAGNRRILHPRPMAEIGTAAPTPEVAADSRLGGCADAIVDAFSDGRHVCQLSEVVKEDTGQILAVRFATRCLVSDPKGEQASLPDLRVSSFWTSVKLGLGLVDHDNLSGAVLATR